MSKNNFISWLLLALVIVIALAGIGFVIYVYATYAGTPVKDLPAWVLPFFNN